MTKKIKRVLSAKFVVLSVRALLLCLVLLRAGAASAADSGQDSLPARYSRGTDAFHSYLPSYIGYTVHNSDSDNTKELKFQFSVKYEFIENSEWYFAYTQKSFWSTQKASAPFRETNFTPETFWLYKADNLPWLPVIQAGIFRHESTGEEGIGSHGWNITYVEPAFHWGGLYIIPRIWAPSVLHGFDEKKAATDNPDIFRYFGYGKLSAIYGSNSDIQLALSLQYAPKDNSTTWEGQADIAWRSMAAAFNKLLGISYIPKWNPSYFVQARNGYGEGLKTYNAKTSSVIVGVSLVR
jgi:phospholipase A1